MTIIDACPARDQERIHNAIRTLLERMNIQLVEPEKTRTKSVCCGDSLWDNVPVEGIKQWMTARISTLPVDDIVVYCVSCSK
jgi:Fe-S oxidoreductase